MVPLKFLGSTCESIARLRVVTSDSLGMRIISIEIYGQLSMLSSALSLAVVKEVMQRRL